jgi:hypothetical protein
MKIKLSKIQVGHNYTFNIEYNSGAGSGSQGWYNLSGEVKEINAEFIRVIPYKNLMEGNKRSIKIKNYSICSVEYNPAFTNVK